MERDTHACAHTRTLTTGTHRQSPAHTHQEHANAQIHKKMDVLAEWWAQNPFPTETGAHAHVHTHRHTHRHIHVCTHMCTHSPTSPSRATIPVKSGLLSPIPPPAHVWPCFRSGAWRVWALSLLSGGPKVIPGQQEDVIPAARAGQEGSPASPAPCHHADPSQRTG